MYHLCVGVCFSFFLASGVFCTHTPQRSPLDEIGLCMNMDEKVMHRGEPGNLMTGQKKSRASTGMYDCSAADLIKWLNSNVCVAERVCL